MWNIWKPSKQDVLYCIIIFIAAYIVRGIPSWFNWGWGNDFGIYYGLTQSLVDDPQLFRPYTGWGQTYHYFPMLFIIMSGLHVMTGIGIDVLLRVGSPIIGSLSVVMFYFVVKHFKAGEYIPLLAAMLLALNPFHAYQTAHAAPLTIGHLFLVLSLLLFLKKDDKAWAPHALYISTILLIMSHHLTTFVYILIIIGITFFRGLNATKRRGDFGTDIIYIIFLTALTFAYWAFVATPVFNSFMQGGLYLSPLALVGLFYLLIGIMVLILEFKYRYGFTYKPRLFTKKIENALFMSVLIILLASIGLLSMTDLGTGFTFLSIGLVLLVPTLIIYSFGIIALNRVDFAEYGPEVKGIFYPLLAIFIFSIFTWNNVLLPFRFIEYLSYPICVLSVIGFLILIKAPNELGFNKFKFRTKGLVVGFIILLLVSGSTTYAVQRTTSRFEESISEQVKLGLDYIDEYAPDNATIASDHRISNLVWQRGFNATYDYAYNIWFTERWNSSECLEELKGHGTSGYEYGQVGYLIIDSVMVRDGVQSNINETPRIINGEAYEKFNNPPFELVFESASDEPDPGLIWEDQNDVSSGLEEPYPYTETLSKPLPDALNWCRVYRVDWTYIEANELLVR
jgi:hypothetical protein